jgi:hypothetical protein
MDRHARQLGVQIADRRPRIHLTAADLAGLRDQFRRWQIDHRYEHLILVGLSPGETLAPSTWRPVLDALVHIPKLGLFILGGSPEDLEAVHRLRQEAGGRLHPIPPRFPLHRLAALITVVDLACVQDATSGALVAGLECRSTGSFDAGDVQDRLRSIPAHRWEARIST